MIDHVELHVSDPARACAFYRGALEPLGYRQHVDGPSKGFGASESKLDFWVRGGGPSAPLPHVAFNCLRRDEVDAAYRAAIAAGGADNGAPALLARIHPHYYAGFVRDPDGHNVEFVCHAQE